MRSMVEGWKAQAFDFQRQNRSFRAIYPSTTLRVVPNELRSRGGKLP